MTWANLIEKLMKVYSLDIKCMVMQAPLQWYERLSNFLLSEGYEREKTNKTLFIKKACNDINLVQVYVDDIIFGSTNESLCKQFVTAMQGEFEMSMIGELNYFLGLQIK